MGFYKKHLFFCTNFKDSGKVCCGANNAEYYAQYCREQLRGRGFLGKDQCGVSISKCLGRCALGPCLVIYPDGVWYQYKTESDLDLIIEQHCMDGVPVKELMMKDSV